MLQSPGINLSRETPGHWNIVRGWIRQHLLQQPHPLLGERRRQRLVTIEACNWTRGPDAVGDCLQLHGQIGNGRMFEQHSQRNFNFQFVSDA